MLLIFTTLSSGSHPGEPYTPIVSAIDEAPDGIQISIADNRMTASISQASLDLVFAKLAKFINLRVYSDAFLTGKVSASIIDVPVQQGLHQILGGLNFAIEYSNAGGGYPPADQPGVYTVYVFPDTVSKYEAALLTTEEKSPLQSIPPDFQAAGFQPEPWEALNHNDPEVRLAAIEAIAQQAAYEDIGMIYPFINDQSARVREAAIVGISQLAGSDSIRYLEQFVSDPSARVRETSYELAEYLGDTEAVSVLAAGLHDPDQYIQQQTIEALAEVGNREAVTALQGAWRRGGNSIRKTIVLALPELPEDESLELLSIALNDGDEQIRRHAVYAATELESPGAASLIHRALEDEDADVRAAAREAVAEYSR